MANLLDGSYATANADREVTAVQETVLAKPIDCVPGLDELAEAIGARPSTLDDSIYLHAKSGRNFSLVELMRAFVHHLELAEDRIASALAEAYELSEGGDRDGLADGDLLDFDE